MIQRNSPEEKQNDMRKNDTHTEITRHNNKEWAETKTTGHNKKEQDKARENERYMTETK